MSKQRSLRKSKLSFADEEEEEGGEDGNVALPPAAVKAAQQKQRKEKAKAEKKSAALLSFDDGGEDEAGISAKALSKEGKSKSKPTLRIPPGNYTVNLPAASTAHNTQVAAAGEYTAEKLRELQSATQRAPRSMTQSKAAAGTTAGAAATSMPANLIEGQADMDVEAEDEDLAGFGSGIPDQAAIRAAKTKREQLRAAPDYIGLGDGAGGRGRGSSLEPFAAGMKAASSQKRQDLDIKTTTTKMSLEDEDVVMPAAIEDQDQDEDTAWTEEQIRKGMRSAEFGRSANKKKNVDATNTVPSSTTGIGTAAGFLPPSQSAAVAAAADDVVTALRAALQRAQLSQRQAEKNLARTERSLEDCITGITRMEEELKHAGEKYIYIQQLRSYIVDICSMLAEKSPLVEELQDELQRAREERFSAYSRRCKEIEAGERLPAEAAMKAALSVLSSGDGGGAQEATVAAAHAAEKEEENLRQGTHIPVELDEFGRDLNVLRRSKVANRIATRQKKKTQQQEQQQKHYVGDVTTSESEDELDSYTRRKGEVLEAAETVFRDAADEFGSLPAVKSQLEEWKERYTGQYNDAYMAESVPALFAPFIRQELLSWTPLDNPVLAGGSNRGVNTGGSAVGNGAARGYQGFDQQAWHKLLFDYGMPSNGTAPHPNDPDVDLVPRLVRVLVLPIISKLLSQCWRVLSTRQSSCVASMLAELMVYLDAEDKALVGVVKATQARLEEAVEKLVVPSWPPMAATPRGKMYMERAFSRGLRLLRSVCAFHQVLPAGPLQNLAVQQLAVQKLLPYIRAAVVDPEVLAERAGRLLDAFPAAWVQGVLVRGLEGVAEVVQAAVRALEPAAGREESRIAKKSAAKALAAVLKRLGDAKGAQSLRLLFDVVE